MFVALLLPICIQISDFTLPSSASHLHLSRSPVPMVRWSCDVHRVQSIGQFFFTHGVEKQIMWSYGGKSVKLEGAT